jgi:Holliday junction resolvasome RuvABC endonuclease subunit
MNYLGIDPGLSGAAVLLNESGGLVSSIRLEATEHDISQFLRHCVDRDVLFAYLERAQSMPKQGVSSTFKFGMSYGFLRGCLVSHRIPFEEVGPRKWQTVLGCLSGGDKNITKARAQQLFPDVKVTHHIADAMLIAEYCRRIRGVPA